VFSGSGGGGGGVGGGSLVDARNVPTPVIMVYNLPRELVKSENVFNLFCLYGNVLKVRMLTRPENSAYVQYSDTKHAMDAIEHLNNACAFGERLYIQYAMAQTLEKGVNDVKPGFGDGPSGADETSQVITRDFQGSPLNRFKGRERGEAGVGAMAPKVFKPCCTLYFSGAPPSSTEGYMRRVLQEKGVRPPAVVAFIHVGGFSGSSSAAPMVPGGAAGGGKRSGFLEFSLLEHSIEAVILAANIVAKDDCGGTFTIRISFSNKAPGDAAKLNAENAKRAAMRAGLPVIQTYVVEPSPVFTQQLLSTYPNAIGGPPPNPNAPEPPPSFPTYSSHLAPPLSFTTTNSTAVCGGSDLLLPLIRETTPVNHPHQSSSSPPNTLSEPPSSLSSTILPEEAAVSALNLPARKRSREEEEEEEAVEKRVFSDPPPLPPLQTSSLPSLTTSDPPPPKAYSPLLTVAPPLISPPLLFSTNPPPEDTASGGPQAQAPPLSYD